MADILVADDDVDAGDLLAEVLRDEGHEVRVARDGHEALAMLRNKRPALVLLDVEMPQKTGPEMANTMFVQDLGMEEDPGRPHLGRPRSREDRRLRRHALFPRKALPPRFRPDARREGPARADRAAAAGLVGAPLRAC